MPRNVSNLSTHERTEVRVNELLDRGDTFARLDDIVTLLGGTKLAFYPFLVGVGSDVFPYGTGNDGIVAIPSDEAATIALDAEFDPIPLVGGTYGLYFDSDANNHLLIADNATYSHGNGSADTPFSVGAWVMMTEALGSIRSIMAKYGSTANAEEWDFRFDASGNLILELHDASASQKELATGASDVLVPWKWNFVVATYDGAQAAPDVHLYKNASDTNSSGATVEDGGAGYDAMEDGAAVVMIGARDATATPAREFEGYMALPFHCGKELTASEVDQIYEIGRDLLGIGG